MIRHSGSTNAIGGENVKIIAGIEEEEHVDEERGKSIFFTVKLKT